MPLDEYREANRDNWDDRVPIHVASNDYGVAAFKNDEDYVSPVVRFDAPLLGDVNGKSLLHLQCHFGLDTLSWARLGAAVTGIDFSPKAIEAARQLNADTSLSGRFVESELYDSPSALDEQFDIVYTSIGAICWVPEVRRWAEVVAHFLKPGGIFYIREMHPVLWSMDYERKDGLKCLKFPYFEKAEPMRWDDSQTYTDGETPLGHTVTYEWNHSMGEIITSLIDAGLRIEYLKEYPYTSGALGLPGVERGEDGMWRFPGSNDSFPMMYSIRATNVH